MSLLWSMQVRATANTVLKTNLIRDGKSKYKTRHIWIDTYFDRYEKGKLFHNL